MAEGQGGARGLTYPHPAPPAPGHAVDVADGVLWLRVGLPFALDHVNLYAVRDGPGWTVIDTGLNTPATIQAWEAALAGPLGGRPVLRVVCTHMHPDHIGLAGWLCQRFDAPLVMSRLEYVTARMLVADTGRPAPREGEVFYRAAGWSPESIARWAGGFGRFGEGVWPLPQAYQRLEDGDVLRLGSDDWRVVVGAGHSPEHVCLWRERDGVFLSGDQILPRISSNVSVWPTEPDADPLGDWLASIDALEARLPESLLVLPAHGEPFLGVTTRLRALRRGHAVSLERLERALATPKRAIDVFGALFARSVGEAELSMATGEAIAHLNYLERRGRARRRRDADGVDWWTATGETAS